MKSQDLLILAQFWMMTTNVASKKCLSDGKPNYRIYKTLEEFRRNNDSFASENNTALENGIKFDFPSFKVISTNSFVTYDAGNILYLNLSGKSINMLEDNAFSTLYCLYVLDLSNNEIWNLTNDVFSDLSNLNYLNLGTNHLSFLGDKTFSKLVNLKELNLSHNNISAISNNVFNSTSKLETLILSDNMLKYMPKCFYNLRQLKKLNFDHNSVAIINTSFLRFCSKLRFLDFSENQAVLLRLDYGTLNPKILQVFNLSNNYIVNIDIMEVVNMFVNSSTEIDLNENQFYCDEWSSYLVYFKKSMINISPGRSFKAFRNIDGVACDNLNISEIQDPNFREFLNNKKNKSNARKDEETHNNHTSERCVIVVFSIMGFICCACLIGYYIFKRKTRFYFTNIASDHIHLTRDT